MSNLSISKAWDDARPIIARDGKLMFMVALVTVVLPGTLMMLISPEQAAVGQIDAEEQSGWVVLLSLVFALIGIIGSIAISYLALFQGASVGDSLRRGLKRFWTVLGIALVFLVPAIILGVIVALVFVGAENMADLDNPENVRAIAGPALIAFLLLFVLMIYVSVRLLLTTPVVAARDLGPIETIKASWNLTKGNFWRLLGFLILFIVVVLVLMIVVGIIAGLITSLIFGEPEPFTMAALVMGLFSTLVQAGITIVYSTVIARIYHQLAGNPADPTVASVPPTA
ncbi:glycerophosphoryl diester phosphodiesterase membrane domain-containing protein [Sphingomicrobium clamense]|uniref:Glycerophosphoryl diester phosphodiesterase membrane domain-containing protein n=1 Tax=Sphingomicrobium clamense TaxID=2851013 RepID=A0ABS6V5G8_9SPHN|nr:glycerophosphoryl diester phosphodiesterase membrane domain-containing protein [Sphingomicrobium sp. B8]MBW0144805.1 glycerophosphoryl diester phosphodiesterase membrane domain-containing protein [Sphingomicrobium sp. B8]